MLRGKVLYVDDEAINLFIFEKIFQEDFTLICAGSGAEALKIIDSDPEIRLVITDMNMPKMNGIEFIKKAKSSHANIEFVILTGDLPNPEMDQAVNDGLILECIYKPYYKHDILPLVKSLG